MTIFTCFLSSINLGIEEEEEEENEMECTYIGAKTVRMRVREERGQLIQKKKGNKENNKKK